MNKILRILRLAIIIFVGSFLSLVALGWALEDKITELAIDKVSETIDAPMEVGDVHFSLVKHFPLASIHFDDLWIASRQSDGDASQPLDTLLKASNLYAYVDAVGLLKNNSIKVREISLSDGFINYAVDEDGTSNIDFLLSSDTTQIQDQDTSSTNAIDFVIESIALNHVLCKYQDKQLKAAATLAIEEVNGQLDIDSIKTLAAMKGELVFSDLQYGETHLDRIQALDVTFDVLYHNDTIRTHAFSAQTQGVTLDANGDFVLGETMYADMNLNLISERLATLIKYAPDTLLSTFDISQVSGAVNLSTTLQGEVGGETLPNYEAALVLSDATVQYADYPLAYNLAMDIDATNGDQNNNETTQISIRKLETDVDGNHIDLTGSISNLDRINYELRSNMNLDLEKIKKFIPDSSINQLSGKVKAYIATSGVQPDSVDDAFIRQVIDATELNVELTDVGFKMKAVPELLDVSARLAFKQCQFDLTDMRMYLPVYDLNLYDNAVSACVTGDMLNPEHMNIAVSSFRLGVPDSSYIWGNAALDSMKQVSFDIQTDLNLDLGFWKQFAPDTLVHDVDGKLLAKVKSHGTLHLDSLATQLKDIFIDQTDIDLKFEAVTLDMADTLMNIKDLTGAIAVTDHKANIDELQGNYAGAAIRIAQATVENPFNTTMRNQSGFIKADGEYYFGAMDYKLLDELFIGGKSDRLKSSAKPSKVASEPRKWNLDIGGTVHIESFRYDSVTLLTGLKASCQFTDKALEVKGKFVADRVDYGDAIVTDMTGFYNIKETEYTFDQLNFDAFDGSILTSVKIRKLPENQLLMNIKAKLDKLNMHVIVKQFPSVLEEFIKPQELGGILTSEETYLQILMNGNNVDLENMKMKSHILFEDGGFYNYPPVTSALLAMPSTKNNPDTLLFNTIDTYMFIYQNAINIPDTKIITNKLNAKMTGDQTFGEDYDYRVGINYKDVLSKNKKVTAEKENLVNTDIDDIKLDNLKWWKAKGRNGKYSNFPIKSDEFEKKQVTIGVRESWLDLKFYPESFNFDTQVDEP